MEEDNNVGVKEVDVDDIKGNNIKIKKSSLWMIISGILTVLFVISIFTHGFRGGVTGGVVSGEILSAQEAADKAVTYINTNLLQPGTTAKAEGVEEVNNLYNVKLNVGGRIYDSYVTKDGGLLFPSAVDLNAKIEKPAEATPEEQPVVMEKREKPDIQLFVMSHCPFGTQAEKGIIPVVELLGDKIDFDIKYVNYAMHGEKEVKEQLRQYCIKTEQKDKFLPYLKCFLKDGNSDTCVSEVKVDKTKLGTCEKTIDEKYGLTKTLADQASWGGRFPPFPIYDKENEEYGISGSPTLVINDKVVSSARSPAAYLATICGAFNKAPEECDEKLSSVNPSAGFGYEATGGSNTAAQCS